MNFFRNYDAFQSLAQTSNGAYALGQYWMDNVASPSCGWVVKVHSKKKKKDIREVEMFR